MRKLIVLTALTGVAAFAAVTALPAGASPRGLNGQIAYDRTNFATGDQAVYTANPDGTHEQELVANTSGPGWSHDGSKLTVPYFTDDGRIGTATVNANGSGYTPLPLTDPTLNVACFDGIWSPNDATLACQSWDDSNPGRAGIYTISSADGSGLTRLTNPGIGRSDEPGAYSPDGKRIVFLRTDQDGNGVGLFVIKSNGTDLNQITPPGTLIQSGNDGDWSPQGNEILFSRHVTAEARGSLWVIHADGSGLHEINVQGLACGGSVFEPNGFGCHEPHWSPDGTKIIFAGNSPTTGVNIYTVNADGSGLFQVTHDGADDDPSWGTHPSVGSSPIVGRWETVRTCQGLVVALENLGLGPLAPAVVGDYFPDQSPQELAARKDLCKGAKPQIHDHFFTSDGRFGSIDQYGQQVDDGNYEVSGSTLTINSESFQFTIQGQTLMLTPLLTPELKQEALADPLNFNVAGWMVAVAYGGHPFRRVACGVWC